MRAPRILSRMRKVATILQRLVMVLATTALSAACFTSQTIIKVKADGTGTIEQTHLMNSQMMGMASAMAGAAAKEAGGHAEVFATNPSEMFSEEQLRRQAAQWGGGVRFVSHTPLEQGAMKGVTAVFAFDDVNKLTMGADAANRVEVAGSELKADAPSAAPGTAGPAMRFGLTKVGSRSVIHVTFPENAGGTPAGAPDAVQPTSPQIPPEALAMVKSMFEGARIGIDIEVDGRIVASNAPATEGSRATLFAVDFAELLSDPSKLSALQTLKPGVDFSMVRKTLEGVKGVKLPTQSVVSIEFAK